MKIMKMKKLLVVVLIGFLTLADTVRAKPIPIPIDEDAGVGVHLDVDTIVGKGIRGAGRVYSAKFLCGTIPHDTNPQVPPVGSPFVPGTYLTAVNIHNPYHTNTQFKKKALIANPQGKLPGLVGTPISEVLGPNGGLEVDCQNIKELIFGLGVVFVPSEPFFTGFVVVTVPTRIELDVTAVYTVKNVVESIIPPTHDPVTSHNKETTHIDFLPLTHDPQTSHNITTSHALKVTHDLISSHNSTESSHNMITHNMQTTHIDSLPPTHDPNTSHNITTSHALKVTHDLISSHNHPNSHDMATSHDGLSTHNLAVSTSSHVLPASPGQTHDGVTSHDIISTHDMRNSHNTTNSHQTVTSHNPATSHNLGTSRNIITSHEVRSSHYMSTSQITPPPSTHDGTSHDGVTSHFRQTTDVATGHERTTSHEMRTFHNMVTTHNMNTSHDRDITQTPPPPTLGLTSPTGSVPSVLGSQGFK